MNDKGTMDGVKLLCDLTSKGSSWIDLVDSYIDLRTSVELMLDAFSEFDTKPINNEKGEVAIRYARQVMMKVSGS